MSVKIEQDNWSETSRRSFAYGHGSFAYSGSDPEHYVNVACRCTKCGKTFLFTAEEQKIAFEINKEYVSKPKHRCNECQLELEVIQNRERNLQLAWNENSKVLRADREFLNEWITILELIPTFRKKKNCSTITMLRKALHDCI